MAIRLSNGTRNRRAGRGERTRRQAGFVIPFLAILIVILCGMVGLAIDTGLLFLEKRKLQSAADAAAIAGARELMRGNDDTGADVRPAAERDAALNGASAAAMTLHHPPSTGPHAGNPRYVEVILEKQVATTFTRIAGPEGASVRARAIAGLAVGTDFCILALNRAASSALWLHGSVDVTLDCGAMSNSAHPSGLRTSGSIGFSARSIGVTGGYSSNGGSDSVTPDPVTSVPPALDPLGLLPAPSYAGWPQGYYDSSTQTYRCPGGQCVWNAQINIAGPPGSKTFESGIHVLENGLRITSTNVVTAEQAMFYVAGGDLEMTGSSTLEITAPTFGTYRGMAIFGSRSLAAGSTRLGTGGATFRWRGTIYMPTRQLVVSGTASGSTPWGMLIADTVEFAGNVNMSLSYPPADEIPDALRVTLVQ